MLLIKNVYHPFKDMRVDVLLSGEKIEKISASASGDSSQGQLLDGSGYVLLPPMVDAHTHIDMSLFGRKPWFRNNLGADRLERIANERRWRATADVDPYVQAKRHIELAIGYGTLLMRTHVNIDTENGLRALEGVLRAREEYRHLIDIEVVAFPQSGLIVREGTKELMENALKMGADLMGGIDPALMDRDPVRSIDTTFEIAQKYQKPIDMHIHEYNELGAFDIELVCERTKVLSMENLVTVSHAFALGCYKDSVALALTEKIADAKISVMTCGQPYAKTVIPIKRLLSYGIKVGGGNDGIRDTWAPFGRPDMLERIELITMCQNLRDDEGVECIFDVCTFGGANIMGAKDYGLEEGSKSDLLLVMADNITEAVVARPSERIVIRRGEIIAKDLEPCKKLE